MTVAEPPVQISLQRILVATDFSERSERALSPPWESLTDMELNYIYSMRFQPRVTG
jgi:hypothetical protein